MNEKMSMYLGIGAIVICILILLILYFKKEGFYADKPQKITKPTGSQKSISDQSDHFV